MNRIKVSSSNVNSVGYSEGVLEVEFKNKSIYLYKNVPEFLFAQLLRARSKGRFLKEYIEKRYNYRKIQ
jgi:hypothetical protein